MTTAKYTMPPRVGCWVMSASHSRSGSVGENCRSTRSADTSSDASVAPIGGLSAGYACYACQAHQTFHPFATHPNTQAVP